MNEVHHRLARRRGKVSAAGCTGFGGADYLAGHSRSLPRWAEPTDQGFRVDVASGAPSKALGPASLCLRGHATFVGQLDAARYVVDRVLPDLPLVQNSDEILDPAPTSHAALLSRLTTELDRRLPTMPATQP